MSLSNFDYFLLVLVGAFVLWGLFKGLTAMVLGIVGLFAGVILAARYYPLVAQVLPGEGTLHTALAFGITFAAILLFFALLGWSLRKGYQALALSWLDRLLGGAFGFLSGALVATLVILFVTTFLPKREEVLHRSRLAPAFVEFTTQLISLIPEEVREKIDRKYEQLRRHWRGFQEEKEGEGEEEGETA